LLIIGNDLAKAPVCAGRPKSVTRRETLWKQGDLKCLFSGPSQGKNVEAAGTFWPNGSLKIKQSKIVQVLRILTFIYTKFTCRFTYLLLVFTWLYCQVIPAWVN
jgi:hypothetical protein